jgi:hypothetical protein
VVLLVFVLPFKQIGHPVGIMAVCNEIRQALAGKIPAQAAMQKNLGGSAFVDIAFAPEDFSFLLIAAAAMEFLLELAGAAIRSAFSFHHGVSPLCV